MQIARFGRRQIRRDGADIFDVRARRIEVTVVGNDVPLFQTRRSQNALSGASLMRRENVFETGNLAHGSLESSPGATAGIAFVAEHESRPLAVGHGARAAVGQQVDGDVVGVQEEDVVERPGEKDFTLAARGDGQRLGHLDAKRLDDRSHGNARV